MKMLMLVYSGANPRRISSLLDTHGMGYTEFDNGHGAGGTGRHEGSRAWPGESTLFISVAENPAADALLDTLRDAAGRLPAGERLHVALLPTERFF